MTQPIANNVQLVAARLSSESPKPAQTGHTGKSRESSTEAPSTSPRRMQQIWVRMTEIYGHKWCSQYGSEPLPTWAAALSDLTAAQLANGFRWCATGRADPWPPSLPEFRHACLQTDMVPEAHAYVLGMAYASAVQYGRPIPETPPEVIEMCRRATSLALISTSAEKSQQLFGYHYALVISEMVAGAVYSNPTPVQAVEHDQRLTPDEVQSWANSLRALLRNGETP